MTTTSNFTSIKQKLLRFSKKFYTNQLIKGSILFLSFGLLYFFFTLFIEYFLWLQPTARTLLFWLFILVEVFLLVRFIFSPIFRLVGLQKGLSFDEAATIIGKHFPEVKDKLLNLLQLKESNATSELLLASIEQKAAALQPIPFAKAIDFTANAKYLKYAIIPVFIWLITLFTGTNKELSKSFQRVVNHNIAYQPPAPFSFSLLSENLEVIQGKPLTIQVKTVGTVVPEEVKIIVNNQEYILENNGNKTFSYTFSEVLKPIDFYVSANGISSKTYTISVVETPRILQVKMQLQYPKYLQKKNKKFSNTINITVPEGTRVLWKVTTASTDSVAFLLKNKRRTFKKEKNNQFSFTKHILKPLAYSIATSNKKLKNYESLSFLVDVVKDEFPQISIHTDIDSISRGTAQFVGRISDDYGISKLVLVYYDVAHPAIQKKVVLPISKKNIQTFYYQFPGQIELKEGVNYELFFTVFDNDGVNGAKKTKSKTYHYYQKSKETLANELLQEQKNTINNLEKNVLQQKAQQKALKKMQQDFRNKKNLTWSDKKKIEHYIKRQQQYKKMMQRQTDKLQENFDEKKEPTKSLQEKKEALKKRIEELKRMKRQQELMDEIQKIANKLNKEDLLKKTKELAQQNKQQERSLERILEMTKRFYVEQKMAQIANKIDELAKKQDALANKKEKDIVAQKKIKDAFKKIEKELKEVQEDNEKLKKPMELPDTEDEQEDIDKSLKKSEENIEEKKASEAQKSQKKAAKKMKKMGKKMQKSMLDMQGDTIEENMEDLRKILENLITFSYKQEALMQKFGTISTQHPDFGKSLKKQYEIKTYFNHIDDSLYVLSIRLPKLSAKIQNHLASAHYNLDQSLENFSENRFPNGISNQHYVMTAANALANYLSSILTNMKNSISMSGKGKKGGKSFSLPDLIEKQKGLSDKMKKGMQKGKKGQKTDKNGKDGKKGKQGKKGENGKEGNEGEGDENEKMNGELFKIYQQQSRLRQQLQDAIQQGKDKNGAARRALKTMEELENEILEKGFNAGTLQKMQQLNYQLLKLDTAVFEQGEDKKRKSNTNNKNYQQQKLKEIRFKKLFYNQTEILNRQSLPLQQNYKKKVQEYFAIPKKKN